MNSYDWSLLRLLVRRPCKACHLPGDIQQWMYDQYLQRANTHQILKKIREMGYSISHDTCLRHRDHLTLVAAWTHPIEQIRNRVEVELFKSKLFSSNRSSPGEAIESALEVLRKYLPGAKFQKIIEILESDDL